jgi:hypothetical protein
MQRKIEARSFCRRWKTGPGIDRHERKIPICVSIKTEKQEMMVIDKQQNNRFE